MFNEAKLRGINMRKLRQESFTSTKHLKLVEMHELRVAALREGFDFPERPKERPKVRKSVPRSKVKEVIEPTFTETQLRIAQAVLEKMEK